MLDRGLDGADRDDGFSLLEILVALTILSIAVITIVSVLTSMVISTEHHRGQGATDTVIRDFGEAIKQKAIHTPTTSAYQCPTAADLDPSFSMANFTTAIDDIEYWIPSLTNPTTGTWQDHGACVTHYETLCPDPDDAQAACDPGLQRVTISATATAPSQRGGKTESQILVRRGNP